MFQIKINTYLLWKLKKKKKGGGEGFSHLGAILAFLLKLKISWSEEKEYNNAATVNNVILPFPPTTQTIPCHITEADFPVFDLYL